MKILVVDDESAFREVIEEFLIELGHDAVHAGNGKDALTIFQADESSFDLIITDYMMPRIDGERLIHLVREQDKNIPILLISAYVSFELQESIEQLDVTFFEKPIRFDALDTFLNTLSPAD